MSITKIIDNILKDKNFKNLVTYYTYLPPIEAKYIPININEKLKAVLNDLNIESFYSHQVEAIDLIREGKNVVIMSPTASGKSLIYNIPVLESVINDMNTKALYIFPLKGLEQDQFQNLRKLYDRIVNKSEKLKVKSFAEIYDGDTTQYKRRKIREGVPNVIFTNPDMLHLAFNPYHKKWRDFFTNLKFVIIDEIHSYKGVFGSHVANVFRRFRRICEYYGGNPQFIATSATIANPKEIVEKLTGLPFEIVSKSGAPQAGKYFLFMNPLDSPYVETTRLLIYLLKKNFRTIVFTKARKITELIYKWAVSFAPELEDKISPYRAGFLPEERRQIEKKLFSGELLGVISTSALELGVDIGGLDCCILCGYPGSISSTWQRAGRVGRHGQESLIVLIALKDALDQYLINNPESFFEKNNEAVVIDPFNKHILKKHLLCSASEIYLRESETVYNIKSIKTYLNELSKENLIIEGKNKGIWFSRKRLPQRDVSIRSIGESYRIALHSGRVIGETGGFRIFRDTFPGAVYLHKGKQYIVDYIEHDRKRVICREVDVNYYTQALVREDTEIIGEDYRNNFNSYSICYGSLKITQKVTGYEKKNIFDRKSISTHYIDMPEHVFDTEGLWFIINKLLYYKLDEEGFNIAGALHAVEHVLIASIPLFALCDRTDIGGVSYTYYPGFKLPAIFIYDGYEGGIGLTKRVTECISEWLKTGLKIIDDCKCISGCPSCVQDPQCGSSNQPLDKEGAKYLINSFL